MPLKYRVRLLNKSKPSACIRISDVLPLDESPIMHNTVIKPSTRVIFIRYIMPMYVYIDNTIAQNEVCKNNISYTHISQFTSAGKNIKQYAAIVFFYS